MPSLSASTPFTRLQEDLRLGLTSLKDLWNYEAKDWVTSVHAADINKDGETVVLAGSRDGRVCALNRDGEVIWEKVVGEKVMITAIVVCPPASERQSARVATSTRDGKIYVLNESGEEILPPDASIPGPKYWFDAHQPILQMWMDSTLPLTVVFATEDCCYSFDLAGNQLRWSFPVDDPIRAIFTFDVNGDGEPETVIGSENQTLYLISSTGQLLASQEMDQAISTLHAADIDRDGVVEILVGTRSKKLFALLPDLQEKWMQTLSSRSLAIAVADVNKDDQREILVSCDDQSFATFDNTGELVWRQLLGKRYHSLNTSDLDLDGHIEVLAGADDSRVYAFRIQLSVGLEKRIRRDFAKLGKLEIADLQKLAVEHLDLLLGMQGTTYGAADKKISLALANSQIHDANYLEALLVLVKLEQQKFQFLWEKEHMGYRPVLSLVERAGEKGRKVIVSLPGGSLAIFNAEGRFLGSQKASDGGQIVDAQSGYSSSGRGEDLAFITDMGSLSMMNPDRKRLLAMQNFPEPATCFYLLTPSPQSTAEMLIGTRNGKAYLYTSNFAQQACVIELPAPAHQVFISPPNQDGKYQNPELLINTAENRLLAYTRTGNYLWDYQQARGRILALCAKDLDGDGHLEVLIGTEDRNLCVLDEFGKLRWRYVLRHSVLALETADIDNDDQQEILVGCADGVLYVFTSVGDLIWRYTAKDPIQALRIADIDLDGNPEIVMLEENHLEVLQVVDQQEVSKLLALCWAQLFAQRDPLTVLRPLITGNEPKLRAAGLAKLATLIPLPPETLDLLSDAVGDAFTDVRKILPESLMHAYPADSMRARALLTTLFAERTRDVRIEVIEHLEMLARHDWGAIYPYLERALISEECNTRRAAVRKISRLLKDFAIEIKSAQNTPREKLFGFLLIAAQDAQSTWVRQEAGRVLADFLNLFEEESLP